MLSVNSQYVFVVFIVKLTSVVMKVYLHEVEMFRKCFKVTMF